MLREFSFEIEMILKRTTKREKFQYYKYYTYSLTRALPIDSWLANLNLFSIPYGGGRDILQIFTNIFAKY